MLEIFFQVLILFHLLSILQIFTSFYLLYVNLHNLLENKNSVDFDYYFLLLFDEEHEKEVYEKEEEKYEKSYLYLII